MTVSSHSAGRAIARALGTGPSRRTLAAQREVVVLAMQNELRSEPRFFRPLALGFGVAAAAAAIVLFFANGNRELSASLGGKALGERATVQVTAETAETVDFSDGSRLSLEPKAHIELAQLSADQANIHLSQGSVAASIRKGTGRAWTITAGPYAVRVIGTEFSVGWDRDQRAFSISVREGRVLVLGKDLPLAGVALGAGGHFERRAEVDAPAVGRAESNGEAVEAEAASAKPQSSARPVAEPSWEKLAGASQYKRALEAATRAGFERLTLELPENNLLLLANTARYAGDIGRARLALLKLRQRFPGRSAAPVAALYLAQISEDHDKDQVEAANWLNVFLNESPRGELAAGARARLLAILLRQGNQARARQVAADYLRYHPGGPHAAQARSVAGSSAH